MVATKGLSAVVLLALVSGCFYGRTPETKSAAYGRDAIPVVLGALLAVAGGAQVAGTSGDRDGWVAGAMITTVGFGLVLDGIFGIAINRLVPVDADLDDDDP